MQRIHISMKIPKTVRQHWVYMTFWTKKGRWDGVLDFRSGCARTRTHREKANSGWQLRKNGTQGI